jgi:hypothetical protein
MCRQTTLAIPPCSVHSELGSKVKNQEISTEKRASATREGGPYGQAYGGKWGQFEAYCDGLIRVILWRYSKLCYCIFVLYIIFMLNVPLSYWSISYLVCFFPQTFLVIYRIYLRVNE